MAGDVGADGGAGEDPPADPFVPLPHLRDAFGDTQVVPGAGRGERERFELNRIVVEVRADADAAAVLATVRAVLERSEPAGGARVTRRGPGAGVAAP